MAKDLCDKNLENKDLIVKVDRFSVHCLSDEAKNRRRSRRWRRRRGHHHRRSPAESRSPRSSSFLNLRSQSGECFHLPDAWGSASTASVDPSGSLWNAKDVTYKFFFFLFFLFFVKTNKDKTSFFIRILGPPPRNGKLSPVWRWKSQENWQRSPGLGRQTSVTWQFNNEI